MPAGKLELKFSLDMASSSTAQFIDWYERTYRTTNENGRKRKGNAKKAIQDFLDIYLSGETNNNIISQMNKDIQSFKEDTKLSPELQKAKINLSAEKFETLKKLLEESEAEEQKNASASA